MTTDRIAPPAGVAHRDPGPTPPHTEPAPGVPTTSLPEALRTAANLRRARAEALRDWSRDVRPVLAGSLRRRASELELVAAALELRADGMDGKGVAQVPATVIDAVDPVSPEEEQR